MVLMSSKVLIVYKKFFVENVKLCTINKLNWIKIKEAKLINNYSISIIPVILLYVQWK